MYAPGGFDAAIGKWRKGGIYEKVKFLDHLPLHYTCILIDRRETGASGGRVERVTWPDYVTQGVALLDHLGIDRAHVMGGCMGCSVAMAFGTERPDRVRSLVLFWPVGGAKYRLSGHQRFAEHLAFVRPHGMQAVVDLATSEGKPFGVDPRGGPFVSVLKQDAGFAAHYAQLDADRYRTIIAGMVAGLMDRDTSPGASAEDLLTMDIPTLIVPGRDASHATSAARYLEECIGGSQYWDIAVTGQTEAATNALVLEFLQGVDS
eukprot:gene2092-2129_t